MKKNNKISTQGSDNWYAHHLEILHQMFRDELSHYTDDRTFAMMGAIDINDILKKAVTDGESDKISESTLERFIGSETSTSSPKSQTLNLLFSYFLKKEDSKYHKIAKEATNWHLFVKYINERFNQEPFDKKLPATYDRGKSTISIDEFNSWYDECKKVINTKVLPVLRNTVSLTQITKAHEVLLLQQKIASNEIFDVIDHWFWDKYKNKKNKSELIDYYLKADTDRLLPHVIMFDTVSKNKLYISPDSEFEIIDEIANTRIYTSVENILTSSKDRKSLIKILSEGGEGKTTFLLHLSKEYFQTHNIIKLKVNSEVDNIRNYLPVFSNGRPVIILIDNAMNHKNSLERYTNAFDLSYGELGFTVILAERLNSYESIYLFEGRYDNVYLINYKISPQKQILFFETIWEILDLKNNATDYEKLKSEFSLSTLPLRRKVKQLLTAQGIQFKLNIREDWQDWEVFINKHEEYNSLRRLYLIVALFNKFGLSVPMRFKMLTYPYKGDSFLIKQALSKTTSPLFITEIMESEEYIRLRHDTTADEFFLIESHRADALDILKDFLKNISDKYSATLFRNLQEHKKFNNDPYFKNLLTDETRLKLLTNYYHNTEEAEEKGKTLMRLSVLLIRLERLNEAIQLLIKNDDVYSKTLLASIFLRPEYNRIEEAERLLFQVLKDEPGNIYAIEKILHIYSINKSDKSKLDEVVRQLPQDIKEGKTIIRVSVLLIKVERYNDAVELLENFLIISNNAHAKTLLASILLRADFNRIEDAENLLLQVLEDEPKNIYAIEKLLHIYSKVKRDELKLKELILRLPIDIKESKDILDSIILCYIWINDLISAYKNIKIYSKNYPEEDITFFISKIQSKFDWQKNKLFNYCLKEDDYDFAEIILKSIQDKTHISYIICLAQLLIHQNNYLEVLRLLETARQQEKNNLSLIYLLIKACRNLKERTKERALIIDFLKLNSYDDEIRMSFENLISSNCQFTEDEYNEIEILFKKLIVDNNRDHDKMILVEIYKKWFQKKFNLLLDKKIINPTNFVFTLQILTKAKELAKANEFEQVFRTLDDIETKSLQTYRKFINRFSS